MVLINVPQKINLQGIHWLSGKMAKSSISPPIRLKCGIFTRNIKLPLEKEKGNGDALKLFNFRENLHGGLGPGTFMQNVK